jgi:acyl-CoA thioesterase
MADVDFARRMWEDDTASRSLGMEVDALEEGAATVRMRVTGEMVNGHGICHGGYVFTLADSAFALACNSGGRTTVAAGADISFLAAAKEGDVLVAEAHNVSQAGRTGITDVHVTREVGGHVIALFRGRSRQVDRPTPSG